MVAFLRAGQRNAAIMRAADRPDFAAHVPPTRVCGGVGAVHMLVRLFAFTTDPMFSPPVRVCDCGIVRLRLRDGPCATRCQLTRETGQA